MFCAFWALDIAPTLDVLVSFKLKMNPVEIFPISIFCKEKYLPDTTASFYLIWADPAIL